MRTSRQQCESNVYHVVARGVAQQIIFEDDDDRRRFLKLVRDHVATSGLIHAWCLMDNHIHLLVQMDIPTLSKSMKDLLARYAMYFNARHGRVGHLFQGRFLSKPVRTDEQLLATLRYIHLNPQAAGIAPASTYMWSSYREYVSGIGVSETSLALGLLGSVAAFHEFHQAEQAGEHLDACLLERRMGESEALDAARRLLGDNPASALAKLDRKARDKAIRTLKGAGLTHRQIQHVTGASRGVVEKA